MRFFLYRTKTIYKNILNLCHELCECEAFFFRELENAFRHQGEEFLRGMLRKELQVYAERFPGGVNLPMIIQATIEYLVIDKYM